MSLPAWVFGQNRNPKFPWKLGVVTDEISQDLEWALEFLRNYSLQYCELRELWGKNIMNASPEELERAKKLLRKYAVRVSNIALPIFKYDLPEMPAPASQRDVFRAQFTDHDTERLLEKAAQLSHFFNTPLVRIFSYWRVEDPEKAYPFVRDRLARAAEVARRNAMVLVLENEHTCNVGTGRELARMLKAVNSPHLRGVWDPGNAATMGEAPYPDGYQAVRGLFDHMHVKDLLKDSGKWAWAPVGQGVANFPAVFKALARDGYSGSISLETHYRRADGNRLESTRESLESLLKILRETAA
ncbi:MAG: sugar phosphate isomerase/epimerase [Acidobacteria bacterium]|nr:sugar phosphate isomerase/epimerase [Acidobacteriota bacterium]